MIDVTRYYIAMTQHQTARISALLDRIARISAADGWRDDLNPSQWAALSYLARANRFSRAPSQVAAYLAATRGTVSQTLKALARKGLAAEQRSDSDKRWTLYQVTPAGHAALKRSSVIDAALAELSAAEIAALDGGLQALVTGALAARGGRVFGVCRTCAHFQKRDAGHYCGLLKEPLTVEDADLICHEHRDAA